MRAAAAWLTLAGALPACAAVSDSTKDGPSARPSGLRGTVRISPPGGPCVQGQPCSEPARGLTLVFAERTGRRTRTRTNARGAYRIALAPGRYSVSTPAHAPGNPGSGLAPRRVVVPADRFLRVDFTLDVGLL